MAGLLIGVVSLILLGTSVASACFCCYFAAHLAGNLSCLGLSLLQLLLCAFLETSVVSACPCCGCWSASGALLLLAFARLLECCCFAPQLRQSGVLLFCCARASSASWPAWAFESGLRAMFGLLSAVADLDLVVRRLSLLKPCPFFSWGEDLLSVRLKRQGVPLLLRGLQVNRHHRRWSDLAIGQSSQC